MRDAITAWTLSRDLDVAYSAEEIAKVDAPVLEMPSALLAFENLMIIEREIFCSLRNHVVWARTSRVDDPREFTTPDAFRIATHEMYRKRMHMEYATGKKQDQWRMELPLVAHTNWTQRISLRDLARLILYFGYLQNKSNYNKRLAVRFGDLQFKLIEVMCEMCGGVVAHEILNNVKLAKFLHEGILPTCSEIVVQDNFKTIYAQVNVALRAQIIRHRELQFIDEFWSLINCEDLPYLQLKNTVNMQITARNDIWHAVMSKRACWIAQADLWEPLIRASGLHPPLPCDGTNHCPFETDAFARLEQGKDPNPPCPVFCNLYKIDKTPYRAAMMKEANERGEFWMNEVAR